MTKREGLLGKGWEADGFRRASLKSSAVPEKFQEDAFRLINRKYSRQSYNL